jgi:hypothetical protein
LADPSKVCHPSVRDAKYPIDHVQGASGGLLNNNTALICGGYQYSTSKVLDDCFAINGTAVEAKLKLTQPRSYAASVVINGNNLWMTGGRLGSGPTKTTELVSLTGTRPGPDLPLEVYYHCLVSLNDTTVLLIGGNDGTRSKATFYFNSDSETWTPGPSLITGRSAHSCALFKSPLHGHTDTVIVTGGYNNGDFLKSTEWLQLDSTNSWTSGPDLPKPTDGAAIVTTPDGSGVVLIGGYNTLTDLLELKCSSSSCTWSLMEPTLTADRYGSVSMLVPDSFAVCEQ